MKGSVVNVRRDSAKLLVFIVLLSGMAESKLKSDDAPAFTELRNFPARDESIDIAAEVGTDYELFGTLLLEDKSGSKVKTIDKGKRGDAVDITAEILRLWLQGKGKQPVTWQTLIECLQDMKLNVLASNIKNGLLTKGDSDQPPSATVDCHKISKKRELEKAVAEIGDWEVLCENLGVPSPVLQGLRYDNIQNSMKKTRCLEAYLNTGNACWETVVEVVADVPFYNKRVAKEIADKYGVDYSKYVKDEL